MTDQTIAAAVAAAVAAVIRPGPSQDRLWTVSDVALYVGYDERVVRDTIQHEPDFPKPVRALGPRSHPRWVPADVIEWAHSRRI